jgi:hypothetical protein
MPAPNGFIVVPASSIYAEGATLMLIRITIVAVTVFLYRHQAYQCNVSMVLKGWKMGRE